MYIFWVSRTDNDVKIVKIIKKGKKRTNVKKKVISTHRDRNNSTVKENPFNLNYH